MLDEGVQGVQGVRRVQGGSETASGRSAESIRILPVPGLTAHDSSYEGMVHQHAPFAPSPVRPFAHSPFRPLAPCAP